MRTLLSDLVVSVVGIIILFIMVYALIWLFNGRSVLVVLVPITTLALLERWYRHGNRHK